MALLLLQLVDQGLVGLDDRVATHWPAFGVAGKDDVTVRQALCHQAGVPAIREPLTNDDLWDFDRMCAALAATAPWWPAGSCHAYHTNTFGHLVGGLVRQLTSDLPGTRLRAVAEPLDADVYFGLPDSEHARCADIQFHRLGTDETPSLDPHAPGLDDDTRMSMLGHLNPPGYSSIGVVNTAEWRRAQVPSTNGHMTALGVARIYEAIRRGNLLSDKLLGEATRAQSSGPCPTLGQDVTFGLGFQPTTARRPFGPNPGSFGHYGSGGSLGFADPTAGVAFGYVTNHIAPGWQNALNRALVDAVYTSLR